MEGLTMHCRSLPNPREGELTIRLVTGAPTPSDLGVVDAAAHEKTLEFVFDPHYELQTLDRSFRFFSATLKTFFGLDPQASREIGRQMGSVAHDWLRGRRCGLSMWAELKPAPAPAEVILGNLVFNGGDGDGSGECCHVCLEDFERGDVITQLSLCLHKFHNECIGKWVRRNRTCPVCRGRV